MHQLQTSKDNWHLWPLWLELRVKPGGEVCPWNVCGHHVSTDMEEYFN